VVVQACGCSFHGSRLSRRQHLDHLLIQAGLNCVLEAWIRALTEEGTRRSALPRVRLALSRQTPLGADQGVTFPTRDARRLRGGASRRSAADAVGWRATLSKSPGQSKSRSRRLTESINLLYTGPLLSGHSSGSFTPRLRRNLLSWVVSPSFDSFFPSAGHAIQQSKSGFRK